MFQSLKITAGFCKGTVGLVSFFAKTGKCLRLGKDGVSVFNNEDGYSSEGRTKENRTPSLRLGIGLFLFVTDEISNNNSFFFLVCMHHQGLLLQSMPYQLLAMPKLVSSLLAP